MYVCMYVCMYVMATGDEGGGRVQRCAPLCLVACPARYLNPEP